MPLIGPDGKVMINQGQGKRLDVVEDLANFRHYLLAKGKTEPAQTLFTAITTINALKSRLAQIEEHLALTQTDAVRALSEKLAIAIAQDIGEKKIRPLNISFQIEYETLGDKEKNGNQD